MTSVISITGLNKIYTDGFQALDDIHLDIEEGEIFALLGPNGAGKTTLISIVCGIVNASSGEVKVRGHDIRADFRLARQQIGLVPQELSLSIFESVMATVNFSRGLYGKPRDDAWIEKILRDLTLWEKRDQRIMALSGGMKRRVLIAKALAHQPRVLFLDEPTAGVDVELRQEMWELVRGLREDGVTIILTTHYIDEAEEMADRIGVINKGKIILVDEKQALMKKLGKKQLHLVLADKLSQLPEKLQQFKLESLDDGQKLIYTFDTQKEHNEIPLLLKTLGELGVEIHDLQTEQSSLEDIFVELVGNKA